MIAFKLCMVFVLAAGQTWLFAKLWNASAHRAMVVLVLAAGLALGLCLSFVVYSVGENTKIEGLPLPIAIFSLEESGWVDFVPTRLAGALTVLFNMLTVSNFFCIMFLLLRRLLISCCPRRIQPDR